MPDPQEPRRPQRKPSDWSPRPIPQPAAERRTADPETPTLKELAARAQQRASLAAPMASGASHMIEPKWTSLDDGAGTPAPGGPGTPGAPTTPQQQKLHDIKALLQQSATGRGALKTLDANKVPVGFKAGGGSYWNGTKIVIDQTQNTEEAALTLVHEANHARATLEGLTGNPMTQARGAYVTTMINEESVGTVRSIVAKRELVAAGVPVTATFPLESQYTAAYNSAAARLAATNPHASATARALVGARAGLARVRQGFRNGEVVTSTNGQPYPAYYGTNWDAQHPHPPAKNGP